MKAAIRSIGLALAALSLTAASTAANADRGYRNYHHGGHGHYHGGPYYGGRASFGIVLGAPLWYPSPYYSSYYYPYSAYPAYPAYPYTAPVVVGTAPRVYVERGDVALQDSPPASSPYWYYCRDSATYYPYVRECASAWERVPARPAP